MNNYQPTEKECQFGKYLLKVAAKQGIEKTLQELKGLEEKIKQTENRSLSLGA